jgi:hypothetical protein
MSTIINATTTNGVVIQPDNSGSLVLQTNSGTTALTIDTSQRAAFVAGTAAAPAITTTGDTNTGMFFPAADTIAFAEGGAESMRIDSSGNVGIGTSSPITKLNISGSSGFSGELGTLAVTGNTTAKRLAFGVDSTSTMYGWIQSVETGIAARDLVLQGLGGNVLVGTTTQANNARMTVLSTDATPGGVAIASSGSLYRQIYLTSTGTVLQFWNGSNQANLSAAGAWTNASDARLKKNIIDIKYGLNTVLDTKPRSFDRNDVEGKYIGFIAQELLPIIPEVVNGNEETQYCVDYGSLVAVAFKAIQEQQTIINDLKARVETLEAK